jgi:leader peptidase (prepilin peptidase)/N-methyltransferase
MPGWYFDLVIFLGGLSIGSFLNVCIYRIPRRKSIVWPASFCPKCRAPIRPYDNIPVLSFLLLGGKCRKCRARISPRYPAIELLTALLFLALARKFGLTWQFLRGIVFTGVLIPLSFIDLDRQVVPDAISLPGIAVGLASSLLVSRAFAASLIGLAAGAGVIFLFRLSWKLVRRQEGIGQGDILLAALIGAFLGGRLVLLAIFLAAVLGVLGGIVTAAMRRRQVFGRRIPFGPFLALASLLVLFFGESILNWYGNLFR